MDKIDNRWVTGRCVPDEENPDIFYTTVAEGLKCDNPDELVQFIRIETNGTFAYQLVEMRISGNSPHLVATLDNQEAAVQMWLNLTFGM